MQLNLAQWTGIAVTSIVVVGSDIDVLYAVPLGIFAGALATFFAALGSNAMERPAVERPSPRMRTRIRRLG
jgi:hypothetical protein